MTTKSFPIEKVVVRVVSLPLKAPFTTSFGTIAKREQIIVEIVGGGFSGWGESAVLPFPFYNPETLTTARHILADFAIPIFFQDAAIEPEILSDALDRIVGNRIARSGLEMALWDWSAKSAGIPLYRKLGGVRNEIAVGVSIGIQSDIGALLDSIAKFQQEGYQRIKIKIAPGNDLQLLEAIFSKFPDVPLMVDANSAYSLDDLGTLKAIDAYKLLMIEQPLREDDIYQHSILQKQLRNAICLDESIEHEHDAQTAIELGSCRVINIKPGRVGGLTQSRRIHDRAQKAGLVVWCGGMIETGIGRAANMAIATLPQFTFPGDISESRRHFHDDFVEPEITLSAGGKLIIPEKPGIGFEVNREKLERYTLQSETFEA